MKTINFSKIAISFLLMTAQALAASVYDFSPNNILGTPLSLSSYKGKVLLIVNTASNCGFTPQYEELQALYQKNEKQGLVVLGFPSNDFGGQEPGNDAEIKKFCEGKYKVTFPLFAKSVVKGTGKSPLYTFLTEQAGADMKGEVKWNFEKFLLSRTGKLIGRYGSTTSPDSEKLTAAIAKALAEKP